MILPDLDMITRRIIVVIMLFHATNIIAQDNLHFRNININDGLSDNHVYSIAKDTFGYMWFATYNGLNKYDGYNLKKYYAGIDENTLINNSVSKVFVDNGGNLWILTGDSYVLYDRVNDNFVRDISDKLESYNIEIVGNPIIYADNQKDLWVCDSLSLYFYEFEYNKLHIFKDVKNSAEDPIGAFSCRNDAMYILRKSGVVECMDKRTGNILYRDTFLSSQPKFNNVNLFSYIDDDMNLWVYTRQMNGAWLYNTFFKEWTFVGTTSEKYKLSGNRISDIIDDGAGKIWIATELSGINIIDKKTGKVSYMANNINDPSSLSDNLTCCLFLDDCNTMWIGSWNEGVDYFNPVFESFTARYLKKSNKSINTICEDSNNNLWFGTDGGGIIRFDRKNNVETSFVYKDSLSGFPQIITCQYLDSKNRLWFGTYTEGALYFQDGLLHAVSFEKLGVEDIFNGKVYAIEEDNKGRIWMGIQYQGVICYDLNADTCKVFNVSNQNLPDMYVENLYCNRKNKIYIVTIFDIYVMNTDNFHVERIDIDLNKNNHSTPVDNLSKLFIDSRGLYWIIRYSDLWVYNQKTKKTQKINYNNGLTGNYVRELIEDDYHNIWVTTDNGLTKVEISQARNDSSEYNLSAYCFGVNEGLTDRNFGKRAICKTKEGEIVIGGSNGYKIFKPDSIKTYRPKLKLSFTELTIGNKRIDVGEEYNKTVLVKKNFELLDKINIDYKNKIFNVGFSAFDYVRPLAVKYSYNIDDVSSEWVDLTNNKIFFNNLGMGRHTLRVKAGYLDKSIPEVVKELEIFVRAPWGLSKVAFIIYGVILLALSYVVYSYTHNRHMEKLQLQKAEMDAIHLHEIDEMKLRFFTNISHDIRTPLSLIVIPLEKLIKENSDLHIRKTLELMKNNAKHLMKLLDQLLDFRKLDFDSEDLKLYHGNLVPFINDCVNDFIVSTEEKNISLKFSSETDRITMSFDKDKIQKIIMNLLTNAFRFTPPNGEINVTVESNEGFAIVKVSDTGTGIKDSDKLMVFERFYQIEQPKLNSGSGIGLHIVREFVKLHDGEVWVSDNHPHGAIFTFKIPIYIKRGIGEERNKQISSFLPPKDSKSKDKPSVMVVEDNNDFRTFISECLKDDYKIIEAENGVKALEILQNKNVNIILSDIMMPEMDGYELCSNIKNDINNSHIPIILISARTTDEHILEGLSDGADDYICKPFNLEILKLRIKKFLDWSNKCHDLFRASNVSLSEITISSLDEKLLAKAIAAVEDNISNSEFTVEELSEIVCMSRGHFYKKILAITGKTPIEFIRLLRMKYAIQILKETQNNISEISYMVGFNSPRIFAKYFKEEFGILPSEYKRNMEQPQQHDFDILTNIK